MNAVSLLMALDDADAAVVDDVDDDDAVDVTVVVGVRVAENGRPRRR